MTGFPPQQAEALLRSLRDRGVESVVLAICDLAGQLRGKTLSLEKFSAGLAQGTTFPPIFPITDLSDVVMPVRVNAALDRLGDGRAQAVPDTCRDLPWIGAAPAAMFLAEMIGAEAQWDPRVLYRAVLERADRLGVTPYQAVEYEFTLLQESHDTVHARQFRDLLAFGRQSDLYGVWRTLAHGEFWVDLRAVLTHAGITIEAMHPEFGPGTCEIIMAPAQGIRAADDAAIFRTLVKAHAARAGLLATFMARWSGSAPGNSGHIHLSLRDRDGAASFHDASRPGELSPRGRHFVGGLQRWLPELLLLLLPNVNSFRRYGAGAWSFDPRWCLWGVDNRTTPIRVMPGAAEQLHLEIRIPGADANPYLALGAVLAAGLRGMEESADPTAPLAGNAYESTRTWPEALRLPRTFAEAIDRFAASAMAADYFGAEFQRVFSETRRSQERESRDAVSEWELRRFLE
jgi:glutamine synthetase